MEKYLYDVALSYAYEDKRNVYRVKQILESEGLKIFDYADEQGRLAGKSLTQELYKVYRQESLINVIFISKHYISKEWTVYELKSTLAGTKAGRDCLVPVRLDDAILTDMEDDIVYLDFNRMHIVEIADIILKKIISVKKIHPIKISEPTGTVYNIGNVGGDFVAGTQIKAQGDITINPCSRSNHHGRK